MFTDENSLFWELPLKNDYEVDDTGEIESIGHFWVGCRITSAIDKSVFACGRKDKSLVNLYFMSSSACWTASPQACNMVPGMSRSDNTHTGIENQNFTSLFNFSSKISGLLVADL